MIYPNGGETLYHNEEYTIRWNPGGLGGTVRLNPYRNNEWQNFYITQNTANDGEYTFTIDPAKFPAGTNYKFGVQSNEHLEIVDLSNADFTIVGECQMPTAPTNVQATDGTYSGYVRVTWNAVAGATAYQVYRDGVGVSGWVSATSYNDAGATACWQDTEGVGCSVTKRAVTTPHSYAVKAKNACGESGLSASNSGYRGCSKGLLAETDIYEAALPLRAVPSSELAVRLLSAEDIVPESVWAVAEGAGWSEQGGAWRATSPEDTTDGWVVYRSGVLFEPGEAVTVTVGATTVAGEELEPVSHVFIIGADDAEAGARPAMVVDTEIATPFSPDVPVYRIGPDGVFTEPLTVQVPVPDGLQADALRVYYFSEAPDHSGWYRADEVIGWMVPDSRRLVTDGAQVFIEVQVNHSGVVQMVESNTTHNPADIGLLLGVAGALVLFGVKRRKA